MNSPQPNPPPARHPRRWQILALVLLLLGFLAAGWVWWQGRTAADLQDDPAMLGFNRRSHRQMGLLYGKSGYLIDDLLESLKQPGTQAVIILAATALLAGGCIFISRLPESPADPDFFKPFKPAGDKRDGP
jgi:drug/metabolite transporter (DMT)-like permease